MTHDAQTHAIHQTGSASARVSSARSRALGHHGLRVAKAHHPPIPRGERIMTTRPMRLIVLIAATILLSSCEMYRSSPQWEALLGPSPTKIAATKPGRTPGTIRPGDSKTYVQAQWGNPCNVRTAASAGLYLEIWDYCNGYYVTVPTDSVVFVDGLVDAIYRS